ncbi:MAG TPA: hypothetical protein VGH15_11160 [Caulobacteraceae bacterium]|jgi:hypothetical protein
MIRALAIAAVISFVIAVCCFAAAFAIIGGPFYIDDSGRFHREDWRDVSYVHRLPAPLITHCV